MLEEQSREHLKNVQRELGFPETRGAIKLLETFPLKIGTTFNTYLEVIDQLARLSPEELEKMRGINLRLGLLGAPDFLDRLDEGKRKNLPKDLRKICDPSQLQYQAAMADLKQMMAKAQELKSQGLRPSDKIERFKKAIWGYTLITDPKTIVDFGSCHFYERFLAQYGYVQKKDQLLHAMEDVIAGFFRKRNIYKTWTTPKPEGLGWISPEKDEAYADFK